MSSRSLIAALLFEFFRKEKNVMQERLMTITLGIIGVFLIAVTYAALYQSKKSQKHISGFPFFGGFILAVAFLFSPIKWLAFLGFIDYGLWLPPYVFIFGYFSG